MSLIVGGVAALVITRSLHAMGGNTIEPPLGQHGLADVPITLRMAGCLNGWAYPYIAEIPFFGRALGKQGVYLGGGHHGQRLNRLYAESVGEGCILEALDKLLPISREWSEREHFGDFVIRAGYVRPVPHGADSYDAWK